MNLCRSNGTFNEKALLRLFRTTDGWLNLLNKKIPLEKQTEELWYFLMEEDAGIDDFELIPDKFRTNKIILSWISNDLGRVREVPKEYWNWTLKFKVLKLVFKHISYAEPLKDIQEAKVAIAQIRVERGIPEAPLIYVPSPV